MLKKYSKEFEEVFVAVQQCNTDVELKNILTNIDKNDVRSTISNELGIELFLKYIGLNSSISRDNFDSKLLRITFLLGHYDITYALKFFEFYKDIARNNSASWIRCQRIENALIKTQKYIERLENNNRSIVNISPYVEENLTTKEFESFEIFREFSKVNEGVYIANIEKTVSPAVSELKRLSVLDDYEIFEKKCLAKLRTTFESEYKYISLTNACVSHEPSGIVFRIENNYKYIYSANGIYHHFRVGGKTALRDSPVEYNTAYMIPRKGEKNYYHTVLDILPNYLGYKLLDFDCPIVISHKLSEIEKYFIEYLDIPTDKIVSTQNSGVNISNAIVPVNTTFLYDFILLMRSAEITSKWSKDAANSYGSHIYISRLKSAARPLTNEKEIEEIMIAAGFDVIYMEDHSLEKQISIMSNAKLVVSPHGAGLTNMIFAQTGTSIIELIPDRYLTPMFRQLAFYCGHKYGVIIGKTEDNQNSDKPKFEWSIDTKKLKIILESILKPEIDHHPVDKSNAA